MKVLEVNETGTAYLKEIDFDLPLYNIGEKIGYYEKEDIDFDCPKESKIIQIDMTIFTLEGKKYQQYRYELKNGLILDENDIAYVV